MFRAGTNGYNAVWKHAPLHARGLPKTRNEERGFFGSGNPSEWEEKVKRSIRGTIRIGGDESPGKGVSEALEPRRRGRLAMFQVGLSLFPHSFVKQEGKKKKGALRA